jgi:predicted RNase H-like nuclease
MTAVIGVDGGRGGWVVARVELADADGRSVRWDRVADIGAVLATDAAAIGVDMPIGLPAHGRRECDLRAKRRLGRAHSRVFFAPPRPVLDATTYAEAGALHRGAADGLGLSVQTWQLVAKIREVDEVADDARLLEVHPELSFAALAGTVLPSKHNAAGREVRLAALRAQWPGLTGVPAGDDALDALAVAWSAARWWRGEAESVPERPRLDQRGRPMRIVV